MGRLYAILRAAFMSDEPVRGAPSFDAFSFRSQRVGVRTSRQRSVVLSLSFPLRLFLYSLFDSLSLIVRLHFTRVLLRSTCVHIFSGSRQKEPSPTKLHLSAGQQREIRFSPSDHEEPGHQ